MNKYFIRHTDINRLPEEVEEGAINENDLDIALMGRIRLEYGERLNQNMLNILENFAVGMDSSLIPPTPTPMPTSSPMPSGMAQTTPTSTINASVTPTPTSGVVTTPTPTPTSAVTSTPVGTPSVTSTPAVTPTVTPSTVPPAVSMPDITAGWVVPSGIPTTALAGIALNGNGTYDVVSKDPLVPSGTWLTAGGSSRVEVFATWSASDPALVPFNGPYNTWINLHSGASFSFRLSSIGGGSATILLTFRDSMTFAQLGASTITVNLTKLA